MILTTSTCQYNYDAVIFSSNSEKDLTIARNLMTLIMDKIKIDDDGTNYDVKVCVFHDSFHKDSNVDIDRINLALNSSSLYFIILTEDFTSESINTSYCCYNAIKDTLDDKKKRIIPVFYRNDKKIKAFIKETKYFRLLVALHLEDIFDGDELACINSKILKNGAMKEFMKQKLKQTFEPVVKARLTRERSIERTSANDSSLYTTNFAGSDCNSIENSLNSVLSLREDETSEQASSGRHQPSTSNHSDSSRYTLQALDSESIAVADESMESFSGNNHPVTDDKNNENIGISSTAVSVNNTRDDNDIVANSNNFNGTKQGRLGIVAQIVCVRDESSNLNEDETQVKELAEN